MIIVVNVEKKPYPFGTTIPYMGLEYFLFKINLSHKIIKNNYFICSCYTKNSIISLIVSKNKIKNGPKWVKMVICIQKLIVVSIRESERKY